MAAQNRGRTERRRFGADLRSRAVELVSAARVGGRSWQWIAEELGVNATLLQRWARDRGSSFVRVETTEEASVVSTSGTLRLRTPEGYAVEGLDVASVADLLHQLR